MRILNIKLIGLLLITSLLGTGCSEEGVVQIPGGAAGEVTNISNSGTVSAKNFNLTADNLAPAVYDATTNTVDNSATVTITASIGDRFNQVLTDSHKIIFKTEYGLIDPWCFTVDGSCSVTWTPSGTLPANDIGGANLGSPATTITAYTYGEEAFTDLNSNGIYDDLDGNFVDLEEPYIDVGNNGIFDLGIDISIDTVNGNDVYGNNSVHDISDTLFNGPSCTRTGACGAVKYAAVWDSVVLKLDGGTLAQFSLGGTVAGLLTGSSVTLSTGTEDRIINADGAFTFVNAVDNSSSYSVLISSQPAGQTCTVTNGTGTVASADVTNITVDCVSNFNVGGTITGLTGNVTLQNNLGDNLAITGPVASGTFTFATAIADGSAYSVTVSTQPVGQVCTVSSGTGNIASAHVTSVAVNCVSTPYTIGGTISGLTGSVDLQNNGGDTKTINNINGSFTFATSDITGNPYNVTVLTQPVGQICSVTGGTGTISGANVTSVSVSCVNDTYTIGGIITGLAGTVSLTNTTTSGTDLLNYSTAGTSTYSFAVSIPNGATYNVAVLTQPTGQICTVTNGSGAVAGANVTNVDINCAANTFTIGGTISGLLNQITLQNTTGSGGTENLSVNAPSTTFAFNNPVTNGDTYAVTVATQPPGQNCTVTNATGTVAGNNVGNVSVSCTNLPYNVGGTLSGFNTLSASGVTLLENNSGASQTLTANGSYSFALQNGDTYNVTVSTQPTNPGQICNVSNGAGTVIGGNVTNVNVTCATLYTVGGTITGLTGNVTLQNSNGDTLPITGPVANGPFTFGTSLLDGAGYTVTVLSQPVGQTCTVTGGSGNIAAANVTNVSVSCVDNTISGSVTGTAFPGGTSIDVLLNTTVETINITVSGTAFQFTTLLDNGASYAVTVDATTNTTALTCTVTGGAGTVAGPVAGIVIDCI